MTYCPPLVIQDDVTAFEAIKETTRPRYEKLWAEFRDVTNLGEELNARVPNEEEILFFIRHLRYEKGMIFIFIMWLYDVIHL